MSGGGGRAISTSKRPPLRQGSEANYKTNKNVTHKYVTFLFVCANAEYCNIGKIDNTNKAVRQTVKQTRA